MTPSQHPASRPCLMLVPESHPKPDKKRSRDALEHASSAQPPSKRARRSSSSYREANAAFWNSLSQVHLTRAALEELDRRNRSLNDPRRVTNDTRPHQGQRPTIPTDRKNPIKHFARHGGPDLTDLRGFPEPEQVNSTQRVIPPRQSTSRTQSKSANTLDKSTQETTAAKTKKTSLYNQNFEQHLIDHCIYPVAYEFPDSRESPEPSNRDDILERLAQQRSSLSPSRFPTESFRAFQRANSQALSEDKIMRIVYPTLVGNTTIPSEGGKALTNWAPLTDGSLATPKPDSYDGAVPAKIDRRIREELNSQIIPSTTQNGPALPNFFVAVKGPDSSPAVVKRQACYDGALGARGMHALRSFRVEESTTLYDNRAYTITSTYYDGTLKLYTTYPSRPLDSNSPTEYHMTQLRFISITDTPKSFREGVSAFRNARDWAKEQRDQVIAAANAKLLETRVESTSESVTHTQLSISTQGNTFPGSESSPDELAFNLSPDAGKSRKRLKTGREASRSTGRIEAVQRSSNPKSNPQLNPSSSRPRSRAEERSVQDARVVPTGENSDDDDDSESDGNSSSGDDNDDNPETSFLGAK